MKAKDLILILQEFDEEALVYIEYPNNCGENALQTVVCRTSLDDEKLRRDVILA